MPALAVAAAAVVVGGYETYQSHQDAVAGQKAATQAAQLRQRADAVTQQRQQAQQLSQARIKAGQVDAATSSGGATGSSAQFGGIENLQTQGASNVGFLGEVGGLTQESNTLMTSAQNYYGESGQAGAIGALAFQGAGAVGGSAEFGKEYDSWKTPSASGGAS